MLIGAHAANVVTLRKITKVHEAIARKRSTTALQWEVSASHKVQNVLSKERKSLNRGNVDSSARYNFFVSAMLLSSLKLCD